jgi:hypothetical protein
MLNQWICIMVCYAEPVDVNHGVLFWASGCPQHNSPWFTTTVSAYHIIIHNHWLSITQHDSQPLAQHDNPWSQPLPHHSTPWFTTSGSELHTMIDNHWLSTTNHDSQTLIRHDTPWFPTTGVSIAHHDSQLLCSNNTSRFITTELTIGLWITVSYDEPMVVNHGVLCWASGCESWCVILSQWLWIMLCYSEPASGCRSGSA